jgi:hypothetical protein
MDGSIDKKLEELYKKLDRAKKGAEFDNEAKKEAYRLTNEIEDLKEKKRLREKERSAAEGFMKIKKSTMSLGKTKQNPPIEILVNVFIDGKHATPTPGDYLHFDKNLNLHKETKTVNQSEIRNLQERYATSESSTALNEDEKARLGEQYLDGMLKAGLSFEPQFYLALGEIKGLLDLTEFTEDYKGKNRSVDKVEANIGTLLRILFDKKEIEVNGQKCEIVDYSWEKTRFPPYGYQTSRIVPVDLNTVEAMNYKLETKPFVMLNALLETRPDPPNPEIADTEHDLDGLVVFDVEEMEKALQSYGTRVIDPENVCLNNHSNYLVYPDLYYSTLSAEGRYEKFAYEYLAYRFSIYHSFFKDSVWTIYSQLPYFVNQFKNSTLVERLLLFAPTKEIKGRLRKLLELWTKQDAVTYRRIAQIQYYTQLCYLRRMHFQIQHRLQFMQLGLNCTIIQILLKEAIRCSKLPREKDKSIRCLSDAAKATLTQLKWKEKKLEKFTLTQSFVCPEHPPDEEKSALVEFVEERGFKINGTEATDSPIKEFRLKDPTTDEDGVDYEEEVDRWSDILNDQKAEENVRRFVSIHHRLPANLECVFSHIQKLQLALYASDIQTWMETWTEEAKEVQENVNALNVLLKEDCVKVVKDLLQDKTCTEKVQGIYKKIKEAAAVFIKRADPSDEAAEYHVLDEKYDEWYAPLNELQTRQNEVMVKYLQCVRALQRRLSDIQSDDTVYGRSVNQLDYAIDAYEKIKKVNPIHETIENIPENCYSLVDSAKVNRYLNILYDLMENKVLRGFMWGADFKYKPVPYGSSKTQHDLIQNILAKKGDLYDLFGQLDPIYVAQYSKFDLGNLSKAEDLYYHAVELIRTGKFLLGTEAVHLALLFKFTENSALYLNCRNLLAVLWKSTGKKIAARRIESLNAGVYSRTQYWLYYGKWVNADRRIADRVKHLLYSTTSINFVDDTVKTLLKIFKDMPIPSSLEDEAYLRALTNYRCIQAAVSADTAENILSDVDLRQKQLEKVLKYFPENHVVSNVVAQIAEALRDTDYKHTFGYVAHALIAHRKGKGRDTHDDREDNIDECGGVDIEQSLQELKWADEKIDTANYYVQTSATEREDEWPNSLEGPAEGLAAIPNFFKMAARVVESPYVDGNYTIRVVVDLILVTHEPAADPKTCEEKYAAARDLYYILTKKEKKS